MCKAWCNKHTAPALAGTGCHETRWSAGLLVCWSAGLLVRWSAGPPWHRPPPCNAYIPSKLPMPAAHGRAPSSAYRTQSCLPTKAQPQHNHAHTQAHPQAHVHMTTRTHTSVHKHIHKQHTRSHSHCTPPHHHLLTPPPPHTHTCTPSPARTLGCVFRRDHVQRVLAQRAQSHLPRQRRRLVPQRLHQHHTCRTTGVSTLIGTLRLLL